MKIRYVLFQSETFPYPLTEGMGGLANAAIEIAKKFKEKGNDVQMLCYREENEPEREIFEGIEFIRVDKSGDFKIRGVDPSYFLSLCLWILKNGN